MGYPLGDSARIQRSTELLFAHRSRTSATLSGVIESGSIPESGPNPSRTKPQTRGPNSSHVSTGIGDFVT